jgi:MFS family permease
MVSASVGTALVFHQVSIFGLLGHSREVIAANFGTIAIVNAIVTLALGRFISRLRPGYVIATQLALMICVLWLSMQATSMALLYVYASVFGVIMALGASFDGSVWADLFGRLHHGAIRGFVATALIVGTSTGPVIFGYSLDRFGSYAPITWAAMAVLVFPMLASMLMKRPRRVMSEEVATQRV